MLQLYTANFLWFLVHLNFPNFDRKMLFVLIQQAPVPDFRKVRKSLILHAFLALHSLNMLSVRY